jgi:hypothetical protein
VVNAGAVRDGELAAAPITSTDAPALRALLDRDPIVHCFVASRLIRGGRLETDPWRAGGELWGIRVPDHGLVSAVYLGANLVPIATTEATRRTVAKRLATLPRRCSSLVGPAEEVMGLWDLLSGAWGPAREVRADQPLLAIDGPALVAPDPRLRRVRPDELDVLLPACVAMFTEEVGVSPTSGGAGSAYRARIAELIAAGRAFAVIEDGRVLFKAEVGAATESVCQVQGVWVSPELRGQGLGTRGMSAVVEIARADISPCVSLYVNAFNRAARAAYSRVGFRSVGRFASVLF